MHVGMSGVLRERNDLAAASQHLDRSRELGDDNGLPQNPYRSRVATARIRAGATAISMAPWHCSMRPSACTSAISHPTCARSPPCGRESGSRRDA